MFPIPPGGFHLFDGDRFERGRAPAQPSLGVAGPAVGPADVLSDLGGDVLLLEVVV